MRLIRYFFYGTGFLLAALSLGAFLAPPLLSSDTVRERALPWLSQKFGAHLSFDRLQLSWFHSQEIKGVSFESKECAFKLDSLTLEAPLWKLLIPGKDLGLIQIQKPTLTYLLEKLPQPEVKKEEEEAPSALLPFLLHPLSLEIQQGLISCQTPQTLVTLQNLSCQAQFTHLDSPLTAKLEAQTVNGQKQGSIHLNIQVDQPQQWLKGLQADIDVRDFPIQLVIPFVDDKLASLMNSWAREPLDFNVQFQRKEDQNDCQIHLSSAPLKTQIHLIHENDFLRLEQPAPLSLVLTKEEMIPILALMPEPITFQNNLEIQAEIESWQAPIQDLERGNWKIKAQTNDLCYERKTFAGHLDALKIEACSQEAIYDIKARSSKTSQILLSTQIGPTLDENGLQTFDLTLEGIQSKDLSPWIPLPSFDLSWVFPLKIETHLQRTPFLSGSLQLSSAKFSSSSKLFLDEGSLRLQDSFTKLPDLQFGTAHISSPELLLTQACASRTLAFDQCTLQATLKSPSLSIEKRELKQIELQSKLDHARLDVDFISSFVTGKTRLSVDPTQIKCLEPLTLKAHFEPAEAAIWLGDLGFIQPVDLEMEVTSGSWQSDKSLEDQWIEASAKVADIIIQKSPEAPLIGIPSTEMQLRSNLSAKSAHVMFYSLPSKEKSLIPASFKGQAQIRDQKLTKAQIEIIDLTSDWLDVAAGAKGKLATLLGGPLNADVNIELGGKNPLIHLSAKTPHLKAGFSWQQDKKWALTKPAELQFQLPTKACIKLFEGLLPTPSSFELIQGLEFVARIDKLETMEKELSLSQIQANGGLFLKKAAIRFIPQDRRSELSELKMNWKFDGPSAFFEEQLSGLVQTTEKYQESSLKGKIEGKSRHENLFDKEKKIVAAQARHKVDLKADQLSTDWIDFAALIFQQKMGAEIGELIGSSFQIQAHLDLDKKAGPVDFDFRSNFSRVNLNGTLQEHAFTLRSPLKAELQPHPGLSRYFTSKSNKSSISSISTREPVHIEISEKNFSLPIDPFDIKKVRIDRLHATMGAIEWQNKGVLHFFVNLLKWQQRGDSQTLTLEPLPIDVSMSEGIVRLERSDVLVAELFPIAAWGTIDLSAQKLNLTVGISKDALDNALAITDLPDGYMMLVPVHGPLSGPAAEATLATTKLAALIARNSKNIVNQIAPQNPTGQLIGGILGAIMPIPDEKATVPAPRYPIPWRFERKSTK